MEWWGWLLFATAICVFACLLTYILARREDRKILDRAALAESRATVAQKALEAERRAKHRIEQERQELARKLQANREWYATARKQLTKGVRDDYERLAGNPAALDRRLNELLSIGPTPPRRTTPLPTDNEGDEGADGRRSDD